MVSGQSAATLPSRFGKSLPSVAKHYLCKSAAPALSVFLITTAECTENLIRID
jgi:hypothetical protein